MTTQTHDAAARPGTDTTMDSHPTAASSVPTPPRPLGRRRTATTRTGTAPVPGAAAPHSAPHVMGRRDTLRARRHATDHTTTTRVRLWARRTR